MISLFCFGLVVRAASALPIKLPFISTHEFSHFRSSDSVPYFTTLGSEQVEGWYLDVSWLKP